MNDIPETSAPQARRSDDNRSRRPLTRRQLTRAGLAAPVALTLMNRTALATGDHHTGQPPANCTISGWVELGMSIAPSGAMQPGPCWGKSPGYWKNKSFAGKGTWNSHLCRYAGGTVFKTLFGAPPVDAAYMVYQVADDFTLGDVLNSEDVRQCIKHKKGNAVAQNYPNFNGGLAFHAVAAYLNASYNIGNNGLSPAEVIQMYQATFAGGTYQVGDVQLTGEDIKRFWQNTYHDDFDHWQYMGV